MKFLLIFLLAFSTVFVRAQTSPTVRFNSIADMLAYEIPSVNSKLSAIVSGNVATGDSFLAGEFAYSASSSATTNTYAVFKPIATTGRWIRITGATYNQTPNITIPSAEDSYAFQLYRGVGTNALSIGATATNAIVQSFASLPLFINPVGANNVIFNELGGNVGIGTPSPASKLHVGSTSTATPRGITSAQYSTSTHGAVFGGRKSRGTEATPTAVATGDTLFESYGEGYDGANYLKMAQIRYEATGTIAATRVPTQIVFATATDATPSVLTDWVVINNAGKVGIGTTIPGAKLEVSGGNIRLFNAASDAQTDVSMGYISANSRNAVMDELAKIDFRKGSLYFTGEIAFSTAADMAAGALLERMRITSTGKVGIGTTGPESALTVNSDTGSGIQLNYNSASGVAANKVGLAVTSGGNLTITPSGSVTTVTGKIASTATAVTIAAAATTFAITSNVVTVTGDAGLNTVATITGGVSGQILTLILADGLVTVTDNATGTANTINLSAAFVSTANDVLSLVFNGTSWREVARSVN